MTENRNLTPRKNIFENLGNHLKLIVKLIADSRVPFYLKALPVGAGVYMIMFPDLAPGPLDDAMVIWLGVQLFIELCPQEVVKEHMGVIQGTIPAKWEDADKENIIDGESKDL